MELINLSNHSVIAESIEVANTFCARFKGLMGRNDILAGEALIINPCNSIHTCFMKFPIDVLFVDENYEVVKTLTGIKPFRISSLVKKAKMVIELPEGTIDNTKTQIGDQLKIITKIE